MSNTNLRGQGQDSGIIRLRFAARRTTAGPCVISLCQRRVFITAGNNPGNCPSPLVNNCRLHPALEHKLKREFRRYLNFEYRNMQFLRIHKLLLPEWVNLYSIDVVYIVALRLI